MCLHHLFEAQAARVPGKIAVSSTGRQITYSDLNVQANRLAHHLRELGIGPDTLVGLCVDRSIDMIVGLLAILKAGGAYLPIDPTYPPSRIELLIKDSQVPVVVTSRCVCECLKNCRATTVEVDGVSRLCGPTTAPAVDLKEGHLAYVIYTSGSTGVPKGVLIEHRNVVRLFEQTRPWFNFSDRDVWTLFHSIAFDFSVWEIWGALLYGGHLVIVPSDVSRAPAQFRTLLEEAGVTVLNQTPSAFRQLVSEEMLQAQPSKFRLRLIIFGGEALELKILEPWIAMWGDARPELVNMFGITETTVHVTYRRITEQDLQRLHVSPIGVAIPDLELHLLDSSGEPVLADTPGNLFVSGAGVARGYLRRPELNALRFASKYVSGRTVRMYDTGDRAIRTKEGEFYYLGRLDDQIKVRGFRIEPREIELCLGGHPDVTAAIITSHDYGDGDIRLRAHLVLRQDLESSTGRIAEIREALQKKAAAELPIHMRPSAYSVLKTLPMTAHGKVDREALRQQPVSGEGIRHFGTGVTTDQVVSEIWSEAEAEDVILGIWEEILQRPNLKSGDDFFDMGGTSLAFIRVLGRINERFEVSLNGNELGGEATIAQLARCITAHVQHKKGKSDAN
jgi:amino acid adenylation domain-containing protein